MSRFMEIAKLVEECQTKNFANLKNFFAEPFDVNSLQVEEVALLRACLELYIREQLSKKNASELAFGMYKAFLVDSTDSYTTSLRSRMQLLHPHSLTEMYVAVEKYLNV